MKTTNHTPGPWYGTDIAILGNDGGTWVAEHPAVKWQTLKSVTKSGDAIVAESIKQANANANLIAAAPDLLSALDSCLEIMIRAVGERLPINRGTECEETDWITAIRKARAAIAKAEGVA